MKVWNYMMIMLTMMIFLSFVGFAPISSTTMLDDIGIEINSTTGELIEGDVANSNWFNKLFNSTTGLIVAAGLAVAIAVGFFTKQFDWKLALVGFFTSFVVFFVTFGWSIIELAKSTGETWLVAVIATIFLPLSAMFIISIVEWFGGSPSD